MMYRWIASCLIILVSLIGLSGCGQKDGLGLVTGTVTLDDKPLPGAMISFYPQDGGRSAHGMTDGAGEYRLQYTGTKDGASIGSHVVKIETGIQVGEDKPVVGKVPKLPSRYNESSELTAEVKPSANTIDFELSSK